MRNHPAQIRFVTLALACALLATTQSGCETLRERTDSLAESSRDLLTWHRKDAKKAAKVPAKMVAIWSESTMYGPGQQPTRGLGGRIYVYNRNHQPIKVDGELVVYAYQDGPGEKGEHVRPDRKYRFTQEELEQLYSPSEFGPSYSIWLPWDEVGGETESISVVPIIKTEEGQALVGDHSRNLLPGKNPEGAHASRTDADGVRRVSFENRQTPTYPVEAVPTEFKERNANFAGGGEQSSEEVVRPKSDRLRSHTINIPTSMQERLRQAKQNRDDSSRSSDNATIDRRDIEREFARLRAEARREAAAAAQAAAKPSIDPANEGWAFRSRSSTRREPFRPRAPIAPTVQEDRGQTGWTRGPSEQPSDLPSGRLELPQNSYPNELGVPRVWIEP